MAIELKITVNHATDLAAEVQQLAEIFGVGTPVEVFAPAPEVPFDVEEGMKRATKLVSEAKATLSRKEQDAAVADMVENGEKDSRYDQLTKGRQNEVDAAIEKKAAAKVKTAAVVDGDDELDDMFADETPAKVITRDDVSTLMGKVCKDSNGSAIQKRALKVREILVDLIPDGEEIKVKNLPEDKLAEAFAKIEKVAETVPVED
jgi:hypothetical protein